MQETIAYGTMMMTLGLVLSGIGWRAGPAAAAAFGVVVLLTAHIVTPADLASGFQVLWRPFLAIVSIMLTANVARRLGILDNFARAIEPRPGQSVGRVFGLAFILSAITSAALNNDAAVLLLTPLIVELVRRCYPDRPDLVVPFAFAVFSAAGVAPLVISNPMNLIVAEYAGIGFNEYALRMIPIAIVGWVTTYAVLRAIFRRERDLGHLAVLAASPHRSGTLGRSRVLGDPDLPFLHLHHCPGPPQRWAGGSDRGPLFVRQQLRGPGGVDRHFVGSGLGGFEQPPHGDSQRTRYPQFAGGDATARVGSAHRRGPGAPSFAHGVAGWPSMARFASPAGC